MKRRIPLLVLAALGSAAVYWTDRSPQAPSEESASAGAASQGASADGRRTVVRDADEGPVSVGSQAPEAGALSPEQIAKRDRLQASDAQAKARRRELFASNIASVDAAIEKAQTEGGKSEYVAALKQRRTLLEDQARAEEAE